MNTIKHFILIPVFNDWRSLNKLLIDIENTFEESSGKTIEVLVVNDNSSEKINIEKKKFLKITKIKVISLSKNLGSQKAIAIGLSYLKSIKEDFIVTVMDGDGEDNPIHINNMTKLAYAFPEYVITSNRKRREESWIIVFCYQIHLLVTFLFTAKWISFGNFSTFKSNNLAKLLNNNSSWFAHSSSVIKNCKIKRVYSKREKRYFDKSKLGFLTLVEHSLRVNSVFFEKILFFSFLYILISYIFLPPILLLIVVTLITIFNLAVCSIKFKHNINSLDNLTELIDNEDLF